MQPPSEPASSGLPPSAGPPPDPTADGGHGLRLVRALVDELDRDPDDRHRATPQKRLRGRPSPRPVDPA